MPPEAIPPLSPHGVTMLEVKLYDCLIEVTRSEDEATKSALFSLGCYLTDTTGIHQGGTLDYRLLNYGKFEEDLSAHFNYDPNRHEILWNNKSSLQPKARDDGTEAKVFVVKSHNSWVTALLAMQSDYARLAGVDLSNPSAATLAMTAHFTISRTTYDSSDDPDYQDRPQSDHSSTSTEDREFEENESDEDESDTNENVKEESDD